MPTIIIANGVPESMTAEEVIAAVKEALPNMNIQVGECAQCHEHVDVRPYGPNGTNICVPCAAKPEFKEGVIAAIHEKTNVQQNEISSEIADQILQRHATMRNVPIQ